MADKLYAGDTLAKIITFKDENDSLFDPSSAEIYIIDPDGEEQQGENPLGLGDLSRTGMGTYKLLFNIPDPAVAGVWTLRIIAVYTPDDLQNREDFPFTVEES